MKYYNKHTSNRSNNRNNNEPYIWVVYNYGDGRYHTFTNKVSALRYYYSHELHCSEPEKKYN